MRRRALKEAAVGIAIAIAIAVPSLSMLGCVLFIEHFGGR